MCTLRKFIQRNKVRPAQIVLAQKLQATLGSCCCLNHQVVKHTAGSADCDIVVGVDGRQITKAAQQAYLGKRTTRPTSFEKALNSLARLVSATRRSQGSLCLFDTSLYDKHTKQLAMKQHLDAIQKIQSTYHQRLVLASHLGLLVDQHFVFFLQFLTP